MRYSQASTAARASVDSYIRRTFRLHQVLSKFLSPGQTEELRVLMSKTGMFIAGSVALQFFNRCRYPSCDLDLYLSVHDLEEVSEWLHSVGYEFDPYRLESAEDAIHSASCRINSPKSGFESSKPRGYELADVVLTFYKPKRDQHLTIQLVASARSHVELVLRFHSSKFGILVALFIAHALVACVMNIITHDQAYCLFPRATLDEERAMSYLCPHNRLDEFEAGLYDKYTARGFDLLPVNAEDLDPIRGSFPVGNRFIGDEQCWTLPVLPLRTDLPGSTVDTNSFYFSAGDRMVPMIEYQHLHLSHLSHQYVFSPEEAENVSKYLDFGEPTQGNIVL